MCTTQRAILSMLLAAVVPCATAQSGPPQPNAAKTLTGENGITVGRTKVFDNRTLTLMLENMSETLRTLQFVDQEPLRKALGLIQGSQVTDVSRSLSILGVGAPKIERTEDLSREPESRNQTTTASGLKDDKKSDAYIEQIVEQKLKEKLATKTVTTTDARNAALPALPDLLPGPANTPAFGQHPQDLLSDQVNLTYQIFNLRMAIDRSLSDRLINEGARLQTVLGFNVSIDPPRDSVDAAAVVEITVESVNGKPVSLVSMLPQEKTYNAVALSNKSNAFGGSAVAKLFTVGYTERRRGQIFYMYRDNDTLSFERMASTNNEITFGWQFRPVLGRRSVSPGMRQMFAVVSVPAPDVNPALCKPSSTTCNAKDTSLTVKVRTYWRKYYGKTLTTADQGIGPWPYVKKGLSLSVARSVPKYDRAWREEKGESAVLVPSTFAYQNALAPRIEDVTWAQMDDKTALVSIKGDNFFSGTTVVIGGSTHSAATGTLTLKSSQTMEVLAPLDSIGGGDSVVIGRYGSAVPLLKPPACTAQLTGGNVSWPVGGRRRLDLRFSQTCSVFGEGRPALVYLNGKRLPGRIEPESPKKGDGRISADLPLDQFPKNDGILTVVFPFLGPAWRFSFPASEPGSEYDVLRVAGDSKTIVFVRNKLHRFSDDSLFGSAGNFKLQFKGKDVPFTSASDNLLRAELDGEVPEGSLLLLEPEYDPGAKKVVGYATYILEIPPLKAKAKPAIEPASGTVLSVGLNDIPKLDFTGEKIGDVAQVAAEGLPLFRIEADAAKKTVSVYLTREITGKSGQVVLQFRDSSGKTIASQQLEIKPGKDK